MSSSLKYSKYPKWSKLKQKSRKEDSAADSTYLEKIQTLSNLFNLG